MNQTGAMIFALVILGIFFGCIGLIIITSYINEKKEKKNNDGK